MNIELTADGSNTLFVPELNEHYHSVKGALTESEHIFIRMGLEHHPSPTPRVLEIGFGTGLNAFLTLLYADKAQRLVRYTTLERYPVPSELIEQLDYPERICPERAADFYALHRAAWEEDVQITPYFTLHKIQTDFTALFARLFECLNPGGILTTYCAKGVVRRTLQVVGFTVERLPGPPEGKREILRASKP